MGMDVYGKRPTAEVGKYFRNNVWWWRPLADYCCGVAPTITERCQYWQSNDGDGLDAIAAIELADALQAEIDSGRTAAYAAIRAAEQDALPDKPCWLCHGSGVRRDAIGVAAGQPDKPIEQVGHIRFGQVGWCNGCDGTGRLRPDETHYPFSVENVEKFIAFLRASGGFEIN